MTTPTTTGRPRLGPEGARTVATELLAALGERIGDREAIQQAIDAVVDTFPDDWPLIMASAVAWTFAEHVRPDPEHPTRLEATP